MSPVNNDFKMASGECAFLDLAAWPHVTKRVAAILNISVWLHSPEGEYNSLLRQI